jgi:hypothetical protein
MPANALHQRNIETGGAILGIELEGRVGKRRSHPQNRSRSGGARLDQAGRK